MPQIASPHLSTMCEAQSAGMPSRRPMGVGAGFLVLLLGVLWSTAGCRVNGSHALGTIGDPERSGKLELGTASEEVPHSFDRHTNLSVRPAENPQTAGETTTRESETAAADTLSTLIRFREVKPSIEPSETSAMKIVLVVGTTEVQEDSVEEGNTDEKVVKSNDRHLLATLKRLRESRAAEDIQSVDDDVVFALPVFGGLISTSKSVSQKKQPSEAASSRAVSMRVLRELPAAPASPVPRAPIMVTAHMQELEEVEDATAISETIAPLPPTPEKETSPHYADVDPIHPDRRPVGRICTDIRPKDPEAGEVNLPEGQAKAEFAQYGPLSDVAYADRGWSCRMYQWEATKLRHRPLYFEEINAERYGYSCCPIAQPVISAAHFFAVVPVLPYKMAVQPSRECIYTLGYYRPGSCVPYQIHWPPLRPTAGLIEAGVITGLIFAIP